jgi:[NiFe] hydrogenase diaphorase moiety small subunit
MSTFKLDGKPIPFTEGQTIMDAALAAGEYIPHLCHNPEFTPHGSCRVCVVQSNGRLMSACTQPAQPDMEIDNSSTRVNDYRKSLLQMLFVEGNHVCPGCEKSGSCQLQAVAYYVGMLTPRFTHFFPRREVDASHQDIAIDFNRCILCELCVRASRDVDGKNVFAINGRGLDAHLTINSLTGKLGDSSLTVDDKAVQVCPVGAILFKNMAYDNPIGKRLYDQLPINVIGDVAANGNNNND